VTVPSSFHHGCPSLESGSPPLGSPKPRSNHPHHPRLKARGFRTRKKTPLHFLPLCPLCLCGTTSGLGCPPTPLLEHLDHILHHDQGPPIGIHPRVALQFQQHRGIRLLGNPDHPIEKPVRVFDLGILRQRRVQNPPPFADGRFLLSLRVPLDQHR